MSGRATYLSDRNISKLLLVVMFIAMRSLLWQETHLPQNLEVRPIGLMQHFVMFSWTIKTFFLLHVKPVSEWKQPSSMIVFTDQPPRSPANHWMSASWTDSLNLASIMSEIRLIYDNNCQHILGRWNNPVGERLTWPVLVWQDRCKSSPSITRLSFKILATNTEKQTWQIWIAR